MNKLKQGALSVHDYIDEFEKLTILCDIQGTKDGQIFEWVKQEYC